ncbi:MAG: SCO family protein [Alkalimonas sp.]|nr:SCO family protein [Alkalimonas sp.]
MLRWSLRHTLISSVLLALLLAATAFRVLLTNHNALELQQAVLLTNPVPISDFVLVDQYQQQVTAADLQGQWHLLSYGFTYCPDICPLTLAKLSRFHLELEQSQAYPDLQLLFYSVDPERDTPETLREYLSFFATDIRGLTRLPGEEQRHQPFEQSLSILYAISPVDELSSYLPYNVDHGVLLYLLNPQAELQAIFTPIEQPGALPDFDIEALYHDYLAIRRYLDQR